MKTSLFLSVLLSVLFAGVALGASVEPSTIAQEEQITNADLGIADPGLLPTSPFYFLKEWRRGVQRIFTFNAVNKAELELKFANEKAAEAQEVAKTEFQNRLLTLYIHHYLL